MEIECIALGEIISDYSYSRLSLLHFSVYFAVALYVVVHKLSLEL